MGANVSGRHLDHNAMANTCCVGVWVWMVGLGHMVLEWQGAQLCQLVAAGCVRESDSQAALAGLREVW